MLQIELRKICFHQKGLIIFLISLLSYATLCLTGGYDSSYVLDQDGDIYLLYMERWQGQLTEESAQELEKEYDAVNRSNEKSKTAFMVLYNQYYYAKDDPTHRYLMDERGWNTLLTHDGINFVLLLCLLAITVPVFCGEYQCGMDQILRSCRNGRNRLAITKLLAMMALSVCAAALFQLIQFCFISCLVGLDGASYPLQSLSFFENSPYTLTIWQAYAIVLFCRCMGAAWLAVLIALFSNILRRTVLTAFVGIAVSVLPHLVGSSFLKYVLPLPAGMLAGTGYLWGKLTEVGYDENWNLTDVVTFPGITPRELSLLIILFLIIIGILFHISLRRFVGKRKTGFSFSAISTVLAVLLIVISLTSCSWSDTSDLTYNFQSDATKGENQNYVIELDTLENKIYRTNKQNGETLLLTREPFATDQTISCIFVTNSDCYYLSQGKPGEGFQVYCIDLNDFSERLYFSNRSENTSTLWGLYQRDLTVDEIMADSGTIASFMVDNGYIYYLQGDQLRTICRLTGYESVVVLDTSEL